MKHLIRWGIAFTLSLLLSILPLPGKLMLIEPPWMLLLLFFMMIYEEIHWSLLLLGIMGLLLDVMQVNLLGEHVLALTLSLWLAALRADQFHDDSINQQMAFVGLLCWIYEGVLCITDWLLGDVVSGYVTMAAFLKGLIAVICWPWLKLALAEYLQPSKAIWIVDKKEIM